MTDLEFYQKALMFQSYLVGKIAQTETYKSNWSDIFCLKEIREAFQKYYTDDNVKNLFSISNITPERAKALRFCRWSDEQPNFYLFPLWFVLFIPYGTEVRSISGDTFKYTEETDLDTRFGCVAFGIELPETASEQ